MVTHSILDSTPVLFGTLKEGILELINEWLRNFQAEISAGQIGARNPSFREFFGVKNSIASPR